MKNKPAYIFIIIFFIAALFFIYLRYKIREHNEVTSFFELKERKGSLALAPEWAKMQNTAAALSRTIREHPKDKKSALGLAAIFIQEARVTGNYSYYDQAAMKQISHVLELDPNDFQALTFKALIYLSLHHFADGLSIAMQAQKINPYNSFIYGILVDADIELGNYTEAIANADKMDSIRPDLRSYSRISYIREIHGDYPGAIDAMKLAVDAGMPGDESTEWTRVQLGHLYESTGDFQNAYIQYSLALEERTGYPYALAGLGHISMCQKQYKTALEYYLEADSLLPDYSFREDLVDLYKLTGENKKADSLAFLLIDRMSWDAVVANSNENMGHYVDKELAYTYLKINKLDKALDHALAEYNRRPDNIEANETLAWVYYNKGDYDKANSFIQKALKTNSKNPSLLCYAGLIYLKYGDSGKARELLTEALKNNPGISENLKIESIHALQTL